MEPIGRDRRWDRNKYPGVERKRGKSTRVEVSSKKGEGLDTCSASLTCGSLMTGVVARERSPWSTGWCQQVVPQSDA